MQTTPISLRYFVVQAMGDTNSSFSDSFTKVLLIPCEKLIGSSNYNRQGYEDHLTIKVDTVPAAKLAKWKKTVASLSNNHNRFVEGHPTPNLVPSVIIVTSLGILLTVARSCMTDLHVR